MLRLLLLVALLTGGYLLLRGILGGAEAALGETFRWMFP